MSQGNQKKFESTRMGPRISHETAFSGPGLLFFISPLSFILGSNAEGDYTSCLILYLTSG